MGVLHVTLNTDILAGNAARQWHCWYNGKPRIVLYCVKRTMSKPVAVLPQVLKIHCYRETVTNVLIKRLLCRLLFTQYKNTWPWLVRIRLCGLVRYTFLSL